MDKNLLIVNFIKELKKQVGRDYILGGGQMPKYKNYNNLDEKGNWIGFDCCGGIMYAIRKIIGIDLNDPGFPIRNVPGMMDAPWIVEIPKNSLLEGDLIFVDVPGQNSNGDIMKDKDGYPIYGVYNHVMTYIDPKENRGNNLITTEGPGGDHRINKKSQTYTKYFKFSAFLAISARIYKNLTRYKFYRIEWDYFKLWDKKA